MALKYRGERLWKKREKCRCGAWLYGHSAKAGYCSSCGPGPVEGISIDTEEGTDEDT